MENPSEIIRKIEAIRAQYPENLMAKHFDGAYFLELDPAKQARMLRIIRTGIENPDSSMGAYAMNGDDYEEFEPFFEPVIREYHKIPDGAPIAQSHDWNTEAVACDLGAVDPALADVSMRVRVGRNVNAFPLAGAMNREDRTAFENVAIKAFEKFMHHPEFGGQYHSITPGSPYEMGEAVYNARVAAHQMFKDMSGDRYLTSAGISADWPYGRGIYISEKEDFLVWVGEEDHLRIMSMMRGGNLRQLFDRLHDGLNCIEESLPDFAQSPRYGFVTSCPTNLGTAMRASLHMKLPKMIAKDPSLGEMKAIAAAHGLAVRGAGGEHSDPGAGGLVDISPSARLGITEIKIMQNLYDGAVALWQEERQ